MIQPPQSSNLGSSQMSINSSGKLGAIKQTKPRDSLPIKESSPAFRINGNYGFAIGRHEKPVRKERKESNKSSRESLKFKERTSIDKNKIKKPRKDEFSPKIGLKSIKVITGSSLKKMHKKELDENGSSHKTEGKYCKERKKINISSISPSPNQSLSIKQLAVLNFFRNTQNGSNYDFDVTNQAKKPLGSRFGSPGLLQKKKEVEKGKTGVKFIGEMKKHGIMDALDDMNKLSEFFQSKPSPKEEDLKNSSIQPDPNEASANSHNFHNSQSTQLMSPNEFGNPEYNNIMARGKGPHHKVRFGSADNEKDQNGSTFLFPFQRRASSHSPTSNAEIQTKIAETMKENIEKERSWSKSAENNKNIPVIANTSFMIGGIDLCKNRKLGDRARRGKKIKQKKRVESKEVDQWLDEEYSSEEDDPAAQIISSKLNFDDFLGEEEILNQVSGTLNKKKRVNNNPSNEYNSKPTECDDWMYQTVGSFNNSSSRERHNLPEEQENSVPNISQMKKSLERGVNKSKIKKKSNIGKFMNKADKILEELTFSIEGEENRDYEDLETYIQN